ncbi:TPA: hypothetical protein OMU21_004869 [Klebsiella aerogenes]|nr:hypothetical protein [Klebsiella aerogenes]
MIDSFLFSKILDDYHRLSLLENAVINYSGGLKNLEKRVIDELHRMNDIDSSAAVLLNDLAIYLHDIYIAGKLAERDCLAENNR